MKKIYIISAAAVIGLGMNAPAFSAEDKVTTESKTKTTVEKDDSGNYKKKQTHTTESTDAVGTTHSTKTELDVKADADGDAERTVTKESSTDPKGMLNKTTTKVTESVKDKEGKIEKEYKKQVDGKTVEQNTEINTKTSAN